MPTIRYPAWYGLEHLKPEYTKKLMKIYTLDAVQAAAQYYTFFPEIEPHYLPLDHYIRKYDESRYRKDRDYRTFKSAPEEIISRHFIEWEDGYGPCTVCEECVAVKKLNDEASANYYRRLKEWNEKGVPM